MRKLLALTSYCVVALFLVSCSKSSSPKAQPFIQITPAAPVDSGWAFETTPIFADEFNYSGAPDTTKWGYDLGGNGWGNQELEYYTECK